MNSVVMKARYLVGFGRIAACAMVLALPATVFGEDFFDLLEPAVSSQMKQAAYEAYEAAEGPRLTTSTPTVAGSKPKSLPETLFVAQAMELVPTPAKIVEPITELDNIGSDDIAGVLGARDPKPSLTAGNELSSLSRPILSLTLGTAPDAQLVEQGASLPDQFAIQDFAAQRFGAWDEPASAASTESMRFGPNHFRFAAPAVYSRPLYFEQPNLERYGHHVAVCEHDNLTQSALSAAHFFATVPVLPYKIGATLPHECSYVLGVYRPGSCNPHQLLRPELSLRGLAFEGAAVSGLIFLIP